jgi:hypothetical protein
MNYPKVLSEHETIEAAHAGQNLARYGDGELKLAAGGNCISQPYEKGIAAELREILKKPADGCLPCIPNLHSQTPKKASWANWAVPPYLDFYDPARVYGSSFVTRPDSAPWCDTPEFWDRIKEFWRGKDVALVAGTMRSLRPEMLAEAASVKLIEAPSGQKGDGAYRLVDQIEEECAAFKGPVLMCLGPTATVLANRLARRGVFAQDLGHIGMFMRSAGAYRYRLDDLISPDYREQLMRKHGRGKWGADGAKHVTNALAYADLLEAETILDYGCGEMKFAEAMKPRRVSGFDPGVPGREGMPKPCDLLVSTDVLEHVEPEKLNNVLGHMRSVCLKGAYLVIATRPAKALLPDKRNAHLIVKPADWWIKGMQIAGWGEIYAQEIEESKEVRLWLKK